MWTRLWPWGCPDALNICTQHLSYVPEAEWGLRNDAPRLMSLSPQCRVWSVQTPQGLRERPAGQGPWRSNTSSGTPEMPQHLRSSLGGYADEFFHQPGEIWAYKSFQAWAIIHGPPPTPQLPGALSHLSSTSAGSRTKRTRFDASGGESTDLELLGTGFAAQCCQD